MNKIFLIIEREFISRVRKKSFIVMTILGPVLFAAISIVPALLSTMDSSTRYKIAVLDNTSVYKECFVSSEKISYQYLDVNQKIVPATFLNNQGDAKYDGLLEISGNLISNPEAVKLYSQNPIGLESQKEISSMLEDFLKKEILKQSQAPEISAIVKQLEQTKIRLSNITISTGGDETSNAAEIATAISILFAFLSYMLIMGYGAQVMKGIMEEKTSRIVEIIISSVKPFQLMMGKILGIALVALTQFVIWIVLTLTLVFVVQTVFLHSSPTQQLEQRTTTSISSVNAQIADTGGFHDKSITESISANLKGIDFKFMLLVFGFYFFGGYLLYAAMFAAVGSAIDPDSDTQQFVMPIMLPLILSIGIAMSAIRDPHGSLAFWASLVPFTSPIVMMARLPYNVPTWELLLSMCILIATFILVTLLAAKIYRVGILMYGKKVTYSELWKWLRYH